VQLSCEMLIIYNDFLLKSGIKALFRAILSADFLGKKDIKSRKLE
jgi:hypothetical protein